MGVLHGVSASPFVRKVRVALAEKGIDYELDPVLPFGVSAEYKKMSPLGKVPCYTPKDGVHIPDSSVIVAYLERTSPNNPLYPENPEDFARALFLEEYADSALTPALGTIFFQRIVAPMIGQQTDEAAIATALETTIPPLLSWLDDQIAGKEFFVGNRLSIADIAIASPFVNFMHGGGTVDAAAYPNVTAFLERMHGRPSFKAFIAEEKAMFAPRN
jgi:glutathione S-transferase